MPEGEAPTLASTVLRAALASIPTVGGAAEVIFSDVRARQAAKAAETVSSIVEATGEHALLDRLANDPELEALFVDAVSAAVRTGVGAKRRLLARAVANAVVDDAVLDENWLIADTLAQLDVPHINALRRLEDSRQVLDVPSAGSSGVSDVWESLAEPVRAALIRTGTAIPNTSPVVRLEHRRREITEFGSKIIAMLREEGLAEQHGIRD